MKIIITDDYTELGKITAQHLLSYMLVDNKRVNMAITAGATPKKVYEYLLPYVEGKDYLNHIHYYNFDEIPFKNTDKDGITLRDLKTLYLTPAKIDQNQIHALTVDNYKQHDQKLLEDGGLDLMLLGIGADGHYCGNLPNTTTFEDFTTKVVCDKNMQNLLSPLFDNKEEIPDYYVTMGPRSVMAAKNLIMIANGKHKAEIVKEFIFGKIDRANPSSLLKLHPNLTLIIDRDAASKLDTVLVKQLSKENKI